MSLNVVDEVEGVQIRQVPPTAAILCFFATGRRGLVPLVRQPQNKYNNIYICMVIYCKNYGEGRWCGSRNICKFCNSLAMINLC